MENKNFDFDRINDMFYITSLKLSFKKARLINLVSKGVYLTQMPNFDLLINNENKHYYIVLVSNDYTIVPVAPVYRNYDHFCLIYLNVTTFFNLHSEDGGKENFHGIFKFIQTKFGMGNLSTNETLDNVIFVFKNISWTGLQHCFRVLGVQLSGGSISLRHLASSVEMNLFKHLFALKISVKDLSESRDLVQFLLKPKNLKNSFLARLVSNGEKVFITQSLKKLLAIELAELTTVKNILLKKITLLQEKNAMQKKIDFKKRELSLIENKISLFTEDLSYLETYHLNMDYIKSRFLIEFCNKKVLSDELNILKYKYLNPNNNKS
uniref:Uncharacterized protein n=1 Tax=Ganoderma calidophilum TaxID=2026244 RepID=A0A2S1WBL6_9APHY|nr:hypothetical protein [Ganoderma calidophilum]AWJ63975.1 hypothetical protein [Ganoderma calidophilum]